MLVLTCRLLTLGIRAKGVITVLPLCVCVCVTHLHDAKGIYIKKDILTGITLKLEDFQLTDSSKTISFKSYNIFRSSLACWFLLSMR